MNTPRPDPDAHWEKLLRQARADAGPPTDLPALLRAVRQAPLAPRQQWRTEFFSLFASGPVVPACLVASGIFAVLTTWQVLDVWESLPWAQLLATTGGVP